MSTDTITTPGSAGLSHQTDAMVLSFSTATVRAGYLARAVSQPLTDVGLAIRIQDAFGLGHLYKVDAGNLVFIADPSIPSDLVRDALQTAVLDRIVEGSKRLESTLAARNHADGGVVNPELKAIPQGCLVEDVRQAYLAILQRVIETPGCRDRVGAELAELF